MKGFIQELSREQLAQRIALYGLLNQGSLEELRRTMRAYVDEHPQEFTILPAELESTVEASNQLRWQPAPNAPPPLQPLALATAEVIDQMRKWGCYFKGRDPISILERMNELQQSYQYTDELMLAGATSRRRAVILITEAAGLTGPTGQSAYRIFEKNIYLPAIGIN